MFRKRYKSSRSNPNGACVEAGQEAPGSVLARDSKMQEASPVLRFGGPAWTRFVTELKAGTRGA